MLITTIVTLEVKLNFRNKLENKVVALIEELCSDYGLTYEILQIDRLWYCRIKYLISLHGEYNKATFVSNYLPNEVKELI